MNTKTILYNKFGLKRNKLIWTETFEDLKAFVLTVVDQEVSRHSTWRLPGGSTWNFKSEPLMVT